MCKRCAQQKQDRAAERLTRTCMGGSMHAAFDPVAREALPGDFNKLLERMGGRNAAN